MTKQTSSAHLHFIKQFLSQIAQHRLANKFFRVSLLSKSIFASCLEFFLTALPWFGVEIRYFLSLKLSCVAGSCHVAAASHCLGQQCRQKT